MGYLHMNYKEQIAIIIPSLDPDVKMLQLVEALNKAGFQKLLIVNDGSAASYSMYYENAKRTYNCVVIEHAVNLGKGRALKDAFNYVLINWKDCKGAITVDSDGQHKVEDILTCAKALEENPDSLIMGCRSFSERNIPFRSRAGNIITRNVLNLLCGIRVSDTQTGLRGLSRSLMENVLSVEGERFEYEMNMLVSTKEKRIPIVEVPIQTIYLEHNKSSHFNPLIDSIKIYAVFLKFLTTAFSSFIIDILLFSIFSALLKPIMPLYFIIVSTVMARIISSIYNFLQNKKRVFKNNEKHGMVAARYYILCMVQMCASAAGVSLLFQLLGINETIIKVVVDLLLFLLSFQVQMKWVFKDRN